MSVLLGKVHTVQYTVHMHMFYADHTFNCVIIANNFCVKVKLMEESVEAVMSMKIYCIQSGFCGVVLSARNMRPFTPRRAHQMLDAQSCFSSGL